MKQGALSRQEGFAAPKKRHQVLTKKSFRICSKKAYLIDNSDTAQKATLLRLPSEMRFAFLAHNPLSSLAISTSVLVSLDKPFFSTRIVLSSSGKHVQSR